MHRAAASPCRAARAAARSNPFVRRALCPLAFAFGVRHRLLSSTIVLANLVSQARPARQALSVSLHHVSPTLPSSGLPKGSRSRLTLGVTRNPSVNLMHRAIALRRSRPVARCLFALAVPQARAIHALRSRPARPASVSVAKASGKSPKQATHGFRNHRGTAFQAQVAPALARRRGQMLVSQWALPLSEGRRSLGGTVSSGSGVGGVQTVPRLSTSLTPNPSIKRTVKGLRPSPAAYVKR